MSFTPSTTEKLILLLLTDIAKKVDATDNVDPDFIREAILTGNHWAVDWDYEGLLSSGKPDSVVTEVTDILDMWGFIEDAGGPKFPGFDGNREYEHVSVARFLTEKMGRFDRFQGRIDNGVLNLERYRRMYKTFEPIRDDLGMRDPCELTTEEVEGLIAERIHPENR